MDILKETGRDPGFFIISNAERNSEQNTFKGKGTKVENFKIYVQSQ